MDSSRRKKSQHPTFVPVLVLLLLLLIFTLPSLHLDSLAGRIFQIGAKEVIPFNQRVPVTTSSLLDSGFDGDTGYEHGMLILEKKAYAKVIFARPLPLYHLIVNDLRKDFTINYNYVFVDTKDPRFAVFLNQPARITLYGVPYYPGKSVIVRYTSDHTFEPCKECFVLASGKQGDAPFVTFFVPGFSGYGINNPNAPYQENVVLIPQPLTNTTDSVLNCTVIGTFDADGDTVITQYAYGLNNANYSRVIHSFDVNVSKDVTTGGVKDFSGYNNNGTLGGGILQQAPLWVGLMESKVGGAYRFDGADDRIVLLKQAIGARASASLEAWVNISSPNSYGTIVSEAGSLGGYSLGIKDGNIFFAVRNGLNPTDLYTVTSSLSTLDTTLYHHLVGIYNGLYSSVSLYVDGNLVGTATAPSIITSLGLNPQTTIGSGDIFSQGGGYFTGIIDQVIMYSAAVSHGEIVQHKVADYSIIPRSAASKHQNWTCTATPTDGFYIGPSNISNQVAILNSAPTHQDPTLISASGSAIDNDDLFCINQNTQDPDNERVFNLYSFTLDNLPLNFLYLPFEQHLLADTEAKDFSNNNNTAYVFGATFNSTSGINHTGVLLGVPVNVTGGLYILDGINDYLEVLNNDTLDALGDFSTDFWVTFHQFINHTPLLMRSSNAFDVNVTNYGIRTGGNLTGTNASELEFIFDTGGDTHHAYTTTGAQLQAHTLYHIAVAKPYGQLPRIYLNGILQSGICTVGACSSLLEENNESLVIGRGIVENTQKYFNGTLDEIRVYDIPLTLEQVKQHSALSYDAIKSTITQPGDLWMCSATPCDTETCGATKNSNTLNVGGDDESDSGDNGAEDNFFIWNVTAASSATYTFEHAWELRIYELPFGPKIHEVTVAKIHPAEAYVTLDIYPLIGAYILRQSESPAFIDLNQDGSYDITIAISSIGERLVTLTFSLYGYSEEGDSSFSSEPSISSPSSPLPQPHGEAPGNIATDTLADRQQPREPIHIPYKTLITFVLITLIFITLITLFRKVKNG